MALGQEGKGVMASDKLRSIPTVPGDYKTQGGTSTSTLSILHKTSAISGALQASSPIISDWPENRQQAGLAKAAAVQASGDGFTVKSNGSLLRTDIFLDGMLAGAFYTGGRVNAAPVILKGIAVVGSTDGYVYGYNLKENKLAWKMMAAAYDQRVMYSSQLESNWPVTKVAIEDGLVKVQAGRHHTLAGGVYYYGLKPETGEIVWKKHSVMASEGPYADPERGLVMTETIALNQVPDLNAHPDMASVSRTVDPVLSTEGSGIVLQIAPGTPVPYSVQVYNTQGKLLLSRSGLFSERLEIPTGRFGNGRHVIKAQVGDKR